MLTEVSHTRQSPDATSAFRNSVSMWEVSHVPVRGSVSFCRVFLFLVHGGGNPGSQKGFCGATFLRTLVSSAMDPHFPHTAADTEAVKVTSNTPNTTITYCLSSGSVLLTKPAV